jgi:hypothetical protein
VGTELFSRNGVHYLSGLFGSVTTSSPPPSARRNRNQASESMTAWAARSPASTAPSM